MAITTNFIKQYIINSETCDVLLKYLRPHNDDLDTKYVTIGLNKTYKLSSHKGVLKMFFNSPLGHINMIDYCTIYGIFSYDDIVSYILRLSDEEVRIMLAVFASLNKLPLTHEIRKLTKNNLLSLL